METVRLKQGDRIHVRSSYLPFGKVRFRSNVLDHSLFVQALTDGGGVKALLSGSISLLTYETRIAKPARKRTKAVTIVDRALIPNDLTIVDRSKDIALRAPYTLDDLEERSLYFDTTRNQWVYKNMLRTDCLLRIRYRSAALVPRKEGSEVILNFENGTVTNPPDIPSANTMLKLNRVFYRKHHQSVWCNDDKRCICRLTRRLQY